MANKITAPAPYRDSDACYTRRGELKRTNQAKLAGCYLTSIPPYTSHAVAELGIRAPNGSPATAMPWWGWVAFRRRVPAFFFSHRLRFLHFEKQQHDPCSLPFPSPRPWGRKQPKLHPPRELLNQSAAAPSIPFPGAHASATSYLRRHAWRCLWGSDGLLLRLQFPAVRPVGKKTHVWFTERRKLEAHAYFFLKKVCFTFFNYYQSLVFLLQLRNRILHLPQLFKPCILPPSCGFENCFAKLTVVCYSNRSLDFFFLKKSVESLKNHCKL